MLQVCFLVFKTDWVFETRSNDRPANNTVWDFIHLQSIVRSKYFLKEKRSFLERSIHHFQYNNVRRFMRFNPNNTRELVYICLHSYQCGSWGDMVVSILQGLLLAITTNRNFQICVTSPCDFEKFYSPANYNWKCRSVMYISIKDATRADLTCKPYYAAQISIKTVYGNAISSLFFSWS